MRSPLSLMAASSGEKEQTVPSEKDEGPEQTTKDVLNGSATEEDTALKNFVGMKMGEGGDRNSEGGEEETKEGSKEGPNTDPPKSVLDDIPRRAKMSISPARITSRSVLDKIDKTNSSEPLKLADKLSDVIENEVTDGNDSGISSLSNCDSENKNSDGISDGSSLLNTIVDGDAPMSNGVEESETNSKSSDSSCATKSLPKARKSVQSLGKAAIKTVNLAPIANKTVKLADLETALKCDKVVDSDSSKREESEDDLTNNNIDSQGESKESKGVLKVKKKRKFKAGNYKFPGQKKKKKYLKRSDDLLDNSCNRSVSSTASYEDMELDDSRPEGDDSRHDGDDPNNGMDTEVAGDTSLDVANTSDSVNDTSKDDSASTNAMTVLSQNSHLAFKAATKSKITARKKMRMSPQGKSVMDLLNSMRKAQAKRQQNDEANDRKNASDKEDTWDDDKNDSVDGDSDLKGGKRNLRDSTDEDSEGTEDDSPSQSVSGFSGKKQKLDDSMELPPAPVVTIVSEHQPIMPGLKSLLPRTLTTTATSHSTCTVSSSPTKDSNSSPLTVLSNQIAAGKNSAVPQKASGPKNSEALRALLVSGSPPFARGSSPGVAMPVLGNVKPEVNGGKVVAPQVRDAKGVSTPNGLCYPVTPPKTPEDGTACDNSSRPPSGMSAGTSPDRDIIPLCCCKINGASFNKLTSGVTYCQALDSVDGKVMGCCNKVSNSQLVRPAVKIPFMAVCEAHRKRLKLHHCCPGCGHFCTQGKFYQCRKEGGTSVHSFHKLCQVLKDGKYYCPHCGEESGQHEVSLGYTETPPEKPTSDTDKNSSSRRKASKPKPSFVYPQMKSKEADVTEPSPSVSFTLPNNKTISTEGLPLGPAKNSLEKMLNCLSQERPKKYRNLSRHMYLPAYEGDLEKLLYMLIDGGDPNTPYEEYDNETPLHGAAAAGHLTICHVLVQVGAVLHLKDKTLKTPLMMAAEHNQPITVQYLMKVGARIDDKGEDGMTSIHYAAKAGHTEVIKLLLDSEKIKPNIQDDGGWTPIIWAAESQLFGTVKYLMSQGADPTLKDNEENTGLHWAAYAGSVPIMDLFLDYGCELDTPNEHGDRPLHIAARQNHYECVVLLLARGSDVETRNNNGETPLTCCLDQTSSTWMALKVNKQLKGFAAKLARPEKLLHRDVSTGREKNPIACVNSIDDDTYPNDYLYVAENVETSPLNINRVITSLQSCRCKDDCSSQFCVCARSSVKCWFDKFGRLTTDFNLVEPPLLFECNKACRCWSNCNNRVVQNGITCRLQLFRTNGRGWGVKTLTDIAPGTFICEYIGELISDSEADRREDDSYLFDLDNKDGETYCIDARKFGNVSRFINHLCEPNVVPVKVFIDHQDLRFPRICFFSSREIKAHEELGFDYGEKFWIIKWKQFTCACQSSKCKYSSETIHKTLADYNLRHGEEEPGTQES